MFFSVFSVPSRVGAVRLVILSLSEAHAPTLKKNQKLKGIFIDFFAKTSHFHYKNALMLIKVMISETSALKSLTSGSPSCRIWFFATAHSNLGLIDYKKNPRLIIIFFIFLGSKPS